MPPYETLYDRATLERMIANAKGYDREQMEQALSRLVANEAAAERQRRAEQKAVEALDRQRDRQERRRKFITGIVQRLTSDGAFRLGVLLLWALTLCAWFYRSQDGSDGRFVYSESRGTVFDKRTGTLYRYDNHNRRWFAENPVTLTQPAKR